MKVQLVNYTSRGMAIQLLPDTDVEFELLHGFWKHAMLKTGHPGDGRGSTGFYIDRKAAPEPTNAEALEGDG